MATTIMLPCHPQISAGPARIGAASIAVSVIVELTKVAARPASASLWKVSLAWAEIAGLRTAVPAPMMRQNAIHVDVWLTTDSAHPRPRVARARLMRRWRGMASMSGAHRTPTMTAAMPPNPRKLPIVDECPWASAAMSTRKLLKMVNGTRPSAAARRSGHVVRTIEKSVVRVVVGPPVVLIGSHSVTMSRRRGARHQR